ncbi:ribose import ATP-binding protein RbsA 1 [Luteitalea sp. TBR-22]|uniref:sugar ABC transporter ATP-binding protein n=1 Tax=Luteitalea sp. TBR-22 TaxID=2802971 RepID=UPI001AF5030F|nr:sugar ABC transporter ATP-binding protein [Luteitalea sp. TBR-22]BCS34323.1 ribose import ATP-binding protein RbsA 1 [Luteitalea sp. TBR-22]
MSALAFEDVSKHFGGVKALRGVSLSIAAGDAHALMGENGAGKSTLMKIAAGIHRPDGGRLLRDGQPVDLVDPRAALDHGIGLVHQETLLFPNLDVAENIFAGHEVVRGWLVDRRAMHDRAAALLAQLHLNVDPSTTVSHLSAAQQQLLQVARALAFDCQVLILDEPTTALTDAEVDHLFAVLERLRSRGVTLIYVSHRLPEVFRLCNTVSVLRDGQHVGTWPIAGKKPQDIVRAMVGRDLETGHGEGKVGDRVRLQVTGLTRRPHFEAVDLQVREGEIVGLFGLIGAGRTEVVETVFGLHRPQAGTMAVDGAPFAPRNPAEAVRRGVVLQPEMRQSQGLFFNLPISENLVLAREAARDGWRRRPGRERAECEALVKRWGIKAASIDVPPDALSGGNQQKVVLAKWLATGPRVLLLDEPTKGVDVGAKHDIHHLIREEAALGMACLVVSSDLPELLALADRIVVLKQGRVQGEVLRGASEEDVMHLATRAEETDAA